MRVCCSRGVIGAAEVAAAGEETVDDYLEGDENDDEEDGQNAEAAVGPLASLLEVQVLDEHGLNLQSERGAQCRSPSVHVLHIVGHDLDGDVVS